MKILYLDAARTVVDFVEIRAQKLAERCLQRAKLDQDWWSQEIYRALASDWQPPDESA